MLKKMSHNPLTTNYIMRLLPQNLEAKSILDCACGYGIWGFNIRIKFQETPQLIGFDIFKPYVDKLKKLKIYDQVFHADILNIPFPDNSFDVVLAAEVIEHLNKKDGYQMMQEVERVAKDLIIITTPEGWHKQGSYDKNKYQMHRSGWKVKEFENEGYKVITYDKQELTRLLKFIEKIRRFIFRLDKNKGIIAFKKKL
jgi:ubiquinone/menaquinone biosynthesis C-methylase UbiE